MSNLSRYMFQLGLVLKGPVDRERVYFKSCECLILRVALSCLRPFPSQSAPLKELLSFCSNETHTPQPKACRQSEAHQQTWSFLFDSSHVSSCFLVALTQIFSGFSKCHIPGTNSNKHRSLSGIKVSLSLSCCSMRRSMKLPSIMNSELLGLATSTEINKSLVNLAISHLHDGFLIP